MQRRSIASNGNDEAAKWRLRCVARMNVFYELEKLGSVATLMCGGLLLLPDGNGKVLALENFSHWRETLEMSPMYQKIPVHYRGRFSKMKYEHYTRIEDGLAALGRCLCLAVSDLEDKTLIEYLALLKIWAVETCIKAGSDEVLVYLKWVAKAAQAAFLAAGVPELPDTHPALFKGLILPFAGQLEFVSRLLLGLRDRKDGLILEEGRSLAQLASISRALPYPSEVQVRTSINEVQELITTPIEPVSADTMSRYKTGLRDIKSRCGDKITNQRTHVSLSASGALENSRSQGGRGDYLVKLAKRACNQRITPQLVDSIKGKVDVFQRTPLELFLAETIKSRFNDSTAASGGEEPNWILGPFLYGKGGEIDSLIEKAKDKMAVPSRLTDILNLVCSADLLKFGDYDLEYEVIHGMLLFQKGGPLPEFIPKTEAIPVRADVSIEAGMKTRLVTAAPGAYVHFGQQLGHLLREYLSTDPFLQVGFEEPDKLWEVLKTYRKKGFNQ